MKQINTKSNTIIGRDINLERYLKDIRKFKPLTYTEERTVVLAAKTGNQQAYETLISVNLKFVINCAKEYQTPNVDILDLISAGNEGLIRAIKQFDMSKEIKFISYAVWHIKNDIIQYLKENNKTVRLPYNKQSEIKEFIKVKEKLEQKWETTLGIDQVEGLTEADYTHIRESIMFNNKAESTSSPVGSEDEGGIVEDLISCPESDFSQLYDIDFKKKAIYQSLSKLTPIQKEIVQLSFGLNNSIERSNEDIARQLKLTAERIRQIKKQALTRLSEIQGLGNCF